MRRCPTSGRHGVLQVSVVAVCISSAACDRRSQPSSAPPTARTPHAEDPSVAEIPSGSRADDDDPCPPGQSLEGHTCVGDREEPPPRPEPPLVDDAALSDLQEAKALFAEGRLAFDEGRFEDALVAFQHAHRLAPRPELRFDIAMCLDKIGHHHQSQAIFRELAADPLHSKGLRDHAAARLDP
jgi:hypothetical protein